MTRRHLAFLTAGIVAMIAVGGAIALDQTPRSRLPPILGGPSTVVRVEGARFEGQDGFERFVEVRAKRLSQRQVHLTVEGETYSYSWAELGLALDRGALLDEWRGLQAEGTDHWFRRTTPAELSVRFEVDDAKARERFEQLASIVERAPIDARVLLREHRVVRAEPGLALDVDLTLERLRTASGEENLSLPAVLAEVPPRVTDDMVSAIDVTRVLAAFETSFRGKAGARAVNIRRAAAYLNETVIGPGEVLSFNDVVGHRSYERGFVDAPVIVNDEMEKDVGGGVCQVATTLHAAAVFGNFEVVRRRSHSRPSGYAPLGLDATVIDGKVDLRVRNPYDSPVLVHAYLPSQYVLRVELLGRSPEADVKHRYSVVETEPFHRRIWERDEMMSGQFEKKQKGTQGYKIVSVLDIHHADGRTEQRRYKSRYYPVPEVFWVGAGQTIPELPQLPDGAAGVIVNGEGLPGFGGEADGDVGAVPSEEGVLHGALL